MTRHYSSTAAPTTLAAGCTDSATVIQVTATTGFPAADFVLALDYGAAEQELVLVTEVAGLNLTVTRGFDSTTAVAHLLGAEVQHVHAAADFRDAQTHADATSGVHGVTGALVGTTATQALTNKDLSSGTNTFPASLATDTEVAAVSTAVSTHAALTAAHGATGAVVGTTNTQTLTNKTLTAPAITHGGLNALAVAIGTSASHPSSPTSGQLCWETDRNRLVEYNGSAWIPVAGTMPYCHLKHTTTLSIGTGSSENVPWNTEVSDTDAWHTANAEAVVVPFAGRYEVTFTGSLETSGTGTMFAGRVRVNEGLPGATFRYLFQTSWASPGPDPVIACGTTVLTLAASDSLTFELSQISGGSHNISANAATGPEAIVRYIGPA